MHVLFVPSWYATPTNPTRGVAFRDQALAVRALGLQVGVLVPPARLRSQNGVRETLRGVLRREPPRTDDILPTMYMPWWGSGTLLRARRDDIALRGFAAYAQLHGRPDVVHAHSALYGGRAAVAIRREHGIPFVITEHFSGFLMTFREGLRGGSPLWPDQRSLVRDTFAAADHRLAVSEPLAAALRALVPGLPFEVLGNCIDTDFFAYTPPPPRQPARFLLVAGLTGNKNVDLALRAFHESFAQSMLATLAIIGDGAMRAELEALAVSLGIEQHVEFLGSRSREEVRDRIRQSHVVLSSSRHETFGVTLIEAMASGRPVIATRSGGPQAFVDASSGILVEPGDQHAFAAAMRRMVDDLDGFDPGSIRERCVARFSHRAIGSRLVEIYEMISAREPT